MKISNNPITRYCKSINKCKINKINYSALNYSLLICLFGYWVICLFPPPADAVTMSNDNYTIEMGDFNMAAGTVSDSKHKLGTTVGQTAPGLFTGKNFKVKSGFEYIYPFSSFSFSLSESVIDFGPLSATNPVTRNALLAISNAPPQGYRVFTYEDHPLMAPNNTTIPDSTCDNGLCTEQTADSWTNTLTYGFGYRCDNVEGTDCDKSFRSQNSFRQFANKARNESFQSLMSSNKPFAKAKTQITYKVNISGTQMPGTYTNTITYIAVPGI